ncbi:MAG: hypothetical protein ACLFUJ_07150 [Phycisphaerae bacterium]
MTPRALLHLIQRAGVFSEGVSLSGWRSRLPWIRATFRPDRPEIPPTPVSLIILCCRRDLDQAIGLVNSFAERFDETILMIDAEKPDQQVLDLLQVDCRVYARSLQGDFSAQRNAAVEKARSCWVLHLDADETPSEALLAELPYWIHLARRHRLRVIGVPRQNWVDGELSEVYPDYQFRLHRADQKWVRKVHEVPEACEKRWRQVWRIPAQSDAVILHHLTRAGMGEKARFYDTIQQGMGQTEGIRSILDRKESQ